MNATLHTGRLSIALAFLFALLGASAAHADSITLAWDPNAEQVAGYAVYVGSSRVDIGSATSYTLTTAVAGQQYCFSVAAYNATGEGPKSSQVCGYSNRFPSLTNPGTQTSTVGQSVSLQLSGSDPDGQPVSYSATGLPPGVFIGSATGFVSGTLTTAGSYTVTGRVYDGVLQSAAQAFTWTVAAAPTADTTAPSVAISAPTSSASFSSSASTITLSGTASDSVGVTSVSWANNRGGSGAASGTSSWGVPSVGLQVGTNVITVTARDAAGNVGTAALTVTHTVPDTTAPAVSITGPTASSTYAATSSSFTITGASSDAVGVTQVSWVNDRGGSGNATGTTTWGASGIVLQSGTNVITVTARDAAANRSTDVLTVTYAAADGSAPKITILGPTTSAGYATTASVVTVGGTSTDDRGVTAVTWVNNRGGSGFSSGTTKWSVPSVPLQGGKNLITVTAQDAAGNQGTDLITVTYTPPDTAAPTVAITSPTTSSSYPASTSSIAIGGTASDAVGVTAVTWSSDRGGSGTASGTSKWSVSGIRLFEGANVITVTARDAAGNQAMDSVTVTYTVAAPAPGSSLTLTATLYTSGEWTKALLQWSWPIQRGKMTDVYLNGKKLTRTPNDGSFTDSPSGPGPFNYRICVAWRDICSNTVTLTR
jgi:hypothetical protein